MVFDFDQLPVPPTENMAYPTNFKTGRRFESGELKEYKKRMISWSLRRAEPLSRLHNYLSYKMPDPLNMIRIDAYFFLQRDRLLTKGSNGPVARKKMDVSNFGKAFYDSISSILGYDDCRICPGVMEPVLITESEGQWVTIEIQVVRMMTDAEFLDNFTLRS